jgi:hypothetical protein
VAVTLVVRCARRGGGCGRSRDLPEPACIAHRPTLCHCTPPPPPCQQVFRDKEGRPVSKEEFAEAQAAAKKKAQYDSESQVGAGCWAPTQREHLCVAALCVAAPLNTQPPAPHYQPTTLLLPPHPHCSSNGAVAWRSARPRRPSARPRRRRPPGPLPAAPTMLSSTRCTAGARAGVTPWRAKGKGWKGCVVVGCSCCCRMVSCPPVAPAHALTDEPPSSSLQNQAGLVKPKELEAAAPASLVQRHAARLKKSGFIIPLVGVGLGVGVQWGARWRQGGEEAWRCSTVESRPSCCPAAAPACPSPPSLLP